MVCFSFIAFVRILPVWWLFPPSPQSHSVALSSAAQAPSSAGDPSAQALHLQGLLSCCLVAPRSSPLLGGWGAAEVLACHLSLLGEHSSRGVGGLGGCRSRWCGSVRASAGRVVAPQLVGGPRTDRHLHAAAWCALLRVGLRPVGVLRSFPRREPVYIFHFEKRKNFP